MSIKDNSNKLTDKLELILTSSGVALTAIGTINPVANVIGLAVNIAALPFAMYNSSLIKKQLSIIIDEFNKLETKVDKIVSLNEEQKNVLLLNEYKFLDYSLKEKMKEKIQAYAKIFSHGISSGAILEDNDSFDIQMDIINSLRTEDIILLNQIYSFVEKNNLNPYLSKFKKHELNAFIVVSTNKQDSLNEYALRHLVYLGLLSEIANASLPNTVGDEISFSDDIIFNYSLTKRCKMIRDIIIN